MTLSWWVVGETRSLFLTYVPTGVPTRLPPTAPNEEPWKDAVATKKSGDVDVQWVCAVRLIKMKKKQPECRRHVDRNVKEEN